MNASKLLSILLIIFFVACSSNMTTTFDPENLDELNSILAKEPNNAEVLHARGKLYLSKGKVDSALIDVKAAIKQDSSKATFFITLADANLMANQSRFTRLALLKAIQLDTSLSEPHMKLAELYVYVEQYQDALNSINQSLRRDSKNPKGYYLKGIIFKMIGDTTKAMSSFLTTTDLDADYVNAYEQMGLIHAARNDKKALDFYNAGLARNDKNAQLLYNKAFFFQQMNQLDSAKAIYQRILVINPQFYKALYNLGYLAFDKESFDEAGSYFERALKINPVYADAQYMVGYCLEQKGNKSDALDCYKKTITINARHELAMAGIARLAK